MIARWMSVLLLLLPLPSVEAGDPPASPGPVPHVLIPTLLAPRVDPHEPVVDGRADDAAWAGSPVVDLEDPTSKQRRSVRLRAGSTVLSLFVLCEWDDAAADVAAGKSDGITLTWLDDVQDDGRPQPAEPRAGDVVRFDAADATQAGRGAWSGGVWRAEFQRSTALAASGARPASGALRVTVEDASRGFSPVELGTVRVRGGWASWRRDFQADAPGCAPADFHAALAGTGKPPSWVVRTFESLEEHALVQEAQDDEGDRFPIAVLDTFSQRDVDLSVRFRAVKGFKDQGAGLIWRVKDARNHYILRANVLEQNVVCFKMQDNTRVDLPPVDHAAQYGMDVAFDKAAWHTLRVLAVADRFQACLDGHLLYEVVDRTFGEPGGVGLWTKSDSVMAFDDFVAVPLDPKGVK